MSFSLATFWYMLIIITICIVHQVYKTARAPAMTRDIIIQACPHHPWSMHVPALHLNYHPARCPSRLKKPKKAIAHCSIVLVWTVHGAWRVLCALTVHKHAHGHVHFHYHADRADRSLHCFPTAAQRTVVEYSEEEDEDTAKII